MKYSSLALLGALLATSAMPALAASTITIPVATTAVSTDPSADAGAFAPAAVAYLDWNATKSNASAEPTATYITTDGKYLYVRFDASQSERVTSAPFADGATTGDSVAVDLWPSGASSTEYRFASAPDGASSATASSGAAPTFVASGATYPGGYTVTMRIPLAQLHGAPGDWKVQLERNVAADGNRFVWSHADGSGMAGALAQAGTMTLPAAIAQN